MDVNGDDLYQRALVMYDRCNLAPPECVAMLKEAVATSNNTNYMAQFWLGRIMHEGEGVKKDVIYGKTLFASCIDALREAAEQKYNSSTGNNGCDADVILAYGICLKCGYGVKVDHVKGVQMYFKSAELGSAKAAFYVRYSYKMGTGVPKSDTESLKWYFKSAEQGYAKSQGIIGRYYELGYGDGAVVRNIPQALLWYRRAADQGYAVAQYALGQVLIKTGNNGLNPPSTSDLVEGTRWLRKAAEQGHSSAQFALGRCYRHGTGVAVSYPEAYRWLKEAAETGQHVQAMKDVAYLCNTGKGIAKNESEALLWYGRAAELGDALAQLQYGNMLFDGTGCATRQETEGVAWFKKAAEQGHDPAQYRLGLAFLSGKGVVAKDLPCGVRWILRACEAGNEKAKQFVTSQSSSNKEFADVVEQVTREQRERQESMHRAVESGNHDELREWIKTEPKLTTHLHHQSGQAPLHLAAAKGDVEAVQILLRITPVNIVSTSGRTALHEAAHFGNVDVVKVLLDNNAYVNGLTSVGSTALCMACMNGKFPAAELLVERGADVNIRDENGSTALEILQEKRAYACIEKIQAILARLDAEQLARAWEDWKEKHKVQWSNVLATGTNDPNVAAAIESIRQSVLKVKQFKPTEEPFFMVKGNHKTEEGLFRALAFSTLDVSSASDIATALLDYEALPGPKSPLLLLAHAKLAEKQGSSTLATALLREFQNRVGDHVAKEWIVVKEQPRSSTISSFYSRPARNQLDIEYEDLLQHVNDDQRKPLDELMKMVGLEEVKHLAVQLYSDMLADKRLRDNGLQDAVCPKALNFMFTGNPGTGKTVTADLFSRLLEQSSARAAYKFLKMTAGEALRKGAKQFAAEVASLTGGRKGIGPPAGQVLRRGMPVEVKAENGQWFPGKISHVDVKANVYHVDYADGTVEEGIPRSRVKAIGEGRNVGGVLFIDEAYDLDPENSSEGRAIYNEIMSVAEEFRDTVTIILAGYKDDIERTLIKTNPGMGSRFRTVHFSDFSESQLAAIWRKTCSDKHYECDEDVTMVAARRLARGIGRKGFGNARDVRKLFESSATFAKMRFKNKSNLPKILMEDVIGKRPNRQDVRELDEALQELDRLTGLKSVKESVKQLLMTAEANYDKELRGLPVDLITLNRLFVGNPGCGKTTVATIYGKILKALRYLSNGDVVQKVASDFIGDVVGASQSKTRAIIESAEGKVLFIDEAYALDDNSFGKQVLDTMVEKIQATAGADIAVIMAGYKQPMLKMLRDQNPGLSSRFDPRFALEFEDYNDEELLQILSKEVAKGRVNMPMEVKLHAVKQLAKRRALPNFGNARAVQTLLSNAKTRRLARLTHAAEGDFSISDVDPDTDEQDPQQALEELKSYGTVAQIVGDIGMSVEQVRKEGGSLEGLVNHFVFTGAPGTGKTTVARLMARVLFSFGITATKDVVETSAQDMIGAYVGHTRKAVQEKMEQARGGVLFIDEAYYLGEGSFGSEAMGQLLNNLTLPEYMNGKTVVVLAGYENQMHEMLERNPGLKSRFTSFVHFEDLSHQKCFEVVESVMNKSKPISFSFDDQRVCRNMLLDAFANLQTRGGWANGRDAKEMANKILRRRALRIARHGGTRELVTLEDVQAAVDEFQRSRPALTKTPSKTLSDALLSKALGAEERRQSMSFKLDEDIQDAADDALKEEEQEEVEEEEGTNNAHFQAERRDIERILKTGSDLDEEHKKALEEELQRLQQLERQIANAESEEERQRLLNAEKKRQELLKKLAQMSKCPAGFVWHREGNGFRCGGKKHFISLKDLGLNNEDVSL